MIEKLCGEANVDAKDVIIAYLEKKVQELEGQLLDASIQIQELTEQDIWCPSNCEKLEKLQQENRQLKEQLLVTQTNEETFRLEMEDITQTLGLDEDTIFDDVKAYVRSLRDNWNKLKEWLKEYEEGTYGLGSYETGLSDGLGDVIKKMQEIEGSDK